MLFFLLYEHGIDFFQLVLYLVFELYHLLEYLLLVDESWFRSLDWLFILDFLCGGWTAAQEKILKC